MADFSFDDIRIPVLPDFDWGSSPADQPEYANPVTLINHELRLANAAIYLAEQQTHVNRKIRQAKHLLADAENELEDFENDLLRQFPPNTTATKSNRLLQIYIHQMVMTHGHQQVHAQLLARVRACRKQVDRWESKKDAIWQVLQSIRLAGEHIQTHLSWLKAEQRVGIR